MTYYGLLVNVEQTTMLNNFLPYAHFFISIPLDFSIWEVS